MITNELLQEKWRTQERMAQEAGNSVKQFLDNNERLVAQMLREHGATLHLARRTIGQTVKSA